MLQKLRQTVRKIPKGKVSTYGAVACAAGYPGAARQVAWALHNSAGRGVPWQRVVGAGGVIRLPGAAGMEQRMRLQTEGVTFRGARVRMEEHSFDWGKKVNRQKSKRKT